jgi:hypothetical protein
MNYCDVDWQNNSHWRQFRINGGPWQDIQLVKDVESSKCQREWSTFENAITVQPGANTIQFRYPTRPPQATWHFNGYAVRDVEIRVDP